MFDSVLIANRGEIACRVIRTCRRLGVRTISVFSEADRGALFTRLADVAVSIGPSPASDSYLRGDRIVAVAQQTGAQAIHPGYGFLAENAGFARACAAAGVRFIGPSPDAMEAMGLKDAAKALMERVGVPVVPGYHGADQDDGRLLHEAACIGFPVLIKAVAGGGGKGMRRVDAHSDFLGALAAARREAQGSFGDSRVLVEKYLEKPRHIELQILADAHGNTLHLHERDCSLQRRHQKVVEEAPAPSVPPALRKAMGDAAVQAARAVQYEGAGTVEMIVDVAAGLSERFYFMEMNTRLQVEHPVTELITGLDLVEWQLRIAAGEHLPLTQEQLPLRGHAIEVRVCAEEPAADFAPRTGSLRHVAWPQHPHLRVETGVTTGDDVSVFYDSMIAKLVVWGEDRAQAIRVLSQCLAQVELAGVQTNLSFLKAAIDQPAFRTGDVHTGFLAQHREAILARPAGWFSDTVALAVMGLLRQREQGGNASPWSDRRSFRVNAPATDVLLLSLQGRALDVVVRFDGARTELRFEGQVVSVEQAVLTGQQLTVISGERLLQASYVVDGERAFLLREAESHELRVRALFLAAAEDAGALGVVRSPLPGRILSVFVATGQRVQKGEPLVSLEAMKMEHTLRASADGVVQSVSVKAQEQVVEGGTLLVLHDPDAEKE